MTSAPLARGAARRRILVVTNPFLGHFLPLVPLAQELLANGHEVAVASEPASGPRLRATGWPTFPSDVTSVSTTCSPRGPPSSRSLPNSRMRTHGPGCSSRSASNNVVDDLGGVVETVRTRPGAARERLSLPRGRSPNACRSRTSWSPARRRRVGRESAWEFGRRSLVRPSSANTWGLDTRGSTSLHRYGVLSLPARGIPRLVGNSWSEKNVRPGGAVNSTCRGAGRALGLRGPPGRLRADGHRVLLDAAVMTRIVAGIGAAGAAAVVTTGTGHDPAAIATNGGTPVIVRRWIDQEAVLPRVDAVVTHGGAGTVAGALCRGLPLVVVPQGADQFARRVAGRGARRGRRSCTLGAGVGDRRCPGALLSATGIATRRWRSAGRRRSCPESTAPRGAVEQLMPD